MRVLFFGTYDAAVHTRVRALMDGFREHGDEVDECNAPLGVSTADRVALLRRPWTVPRLVARVGARWARLRRCARERAVPDAVVVGYMGHFDVHLARRLWPRTPVALDFLISGADTARDRGIRSRAVLWTLDRLDRAAAGAADVPFVDTRENLALLAPPARTRAAVVPVGVPRSSFRPTVGRSGREDRNARRTRVIFFGSFTPLQGALTIARAVRTLTDDPIDVLMAGRGQDWSAARDIAAGNPNIRWVDWIEPSALPERLAEADICLGIFGTGSKALRVVPNKVCHGAAAGCAIVTSDTPPQRRALGDAAVFVRPGDPAELAVALRSLAADRRRLDRLREAAAARAEAVFAPGPTVSPLRDRLAALARSGR